MEYKNNTKVKMGDLSLEELKALYLESSPKKQDLITRHLLKRFEFFTRKHAGKKAYVLASYDYEDWESIIQTSIWEGFVSGTHEIVMYNILNSVNATLTSLQQNISAYKRGYFQETSVDFLETVAQKATVNYESSWIHKFAIEKTLAKLPAKTRRIAELFLEGYPVLTNRWDQPQVGPCIAKFVGLRDAAVYRHIDYFKYELKKELEVRI